MEKKNLGVIVLAILLLLSLVGTGTLAYLYMQQQDRIEVLEGEILVWSQQDEDVVEEDMPEMFSRDGWDITFEMAEGWSVEEMSEDDYLFDNGTDGYEQEGEFIPTGTGITSDKDPLSLYLNEDKSFRLVLYVEEFGEDDSWVCDNYPEAEEEPEEDSVGTKVEYCVEYASNMLSYPFSRRYTLAQGGEVNHRFVYNGNIYTLRSPFDVFEDTEAYEEMELDDAVELETEERTAQSEAVKEILRSVEKLY